MVLELRSNAAFAAAKWEKNRDHNPFLAPVDWLQWWLETRWRCHLKWTYSEKPNKKSRSLKRLAVILKPENVDEISRNVIWPPQIEHCVTDNGYLLSQTSNTEILYKLNSF